MTPAGDRCVEWSRGFYTRRESPLIDAAETIDREYAMRNAIFRAALLLLLLPLCGLAEPVQYTADRWHTRIYFTVSHMGLSNFGGRFMDYEIEFMFDEEDMSNSSITVTVPVSGIDTYSPELNGKMGDEGFFDAAKGCDFRRDNPFVDTHNTVF